MRFTVFFFFVLLVVGGLSVYVHKHASRLFRLSRRGRRVLAGVLAGSAVGMVAGRVFGEWIGQTLARIVVVGSSTVVLAVILSAVLLALFDLPRAIAGLFVRLFAKARSSDRSVEVAIPAGAPAVAVAERTPGQTAPEMTGQTAPEVTGQAAPEVTDQAAREATHEATSTTAGVPAESRILSTAGLPPASRALEDPSRRSFLAQAAAGSAFLIGSGSSIYGSLIGRHDYTIEEVVIPIPGLPKSLDGFTIAQISDVHIGLFVGDPELNAAEDLMRKVRPDLIVMTGDLIDSDARYAERLGAFARRLGSLARRGVTAIPGNHDYFAGIEETLSALKRGGAEVLRNSGQVIGDAGGSFALLGVDDVWAARKIPGGGPDVHRALQSVPRDLPRVLLCHNPVYFPEAAGEVALQLSGHTHGGQVNLLVRPADLVLPHGYVAGLYQRGNSRLYINRGFGTAGPPSRIGSPPEVTRVVLVSA